MRKILHADQRQKQNHKEENLPALLQEQFLLGRELGLMLNDGNIHFPIMKYWRNWCIFFVMHNKCIEKKMEQFNSGELKKVFRNNSCFALIGLIASGRHVWQEEKQEHIPVLYWLFRNNCVSPSPSRTFRTHSYWSFITGQFDYSEQLLPIKKSCRMCSNLHSIMNSGLIPGGQIFKQQTDSVLSACGS